MSNPGFYQHLNTYLVCFFLGAILYGCGVSTEDRPPADSPTSIDGFSLVGNMPPVGVTERFNLDRHSNNDEAAVYFDISWEVQSSDPYSITAHISDDANTSFGMDDLIFLSAQCGSDELAFTCTFVGDQECAISYEPDYQYEVVNGNLVRVVNPGPDGDPDTADDYFEVLADRYFLRCPHGGASISETEITLKMENAGYPASSMNQYIVFTVCNEANNDCKYEIVSIEVLDANP